ncbi:MAG: leucine-rich repeat domain-containing protein, partial [Thermoguttaceae bacterium]|nr:leucine-rich repeat domain-containing protein [Thermoguttaceae bacterium]
ETETEAEAETERIREWNAHQAASRDPAETDWKLERLGDELCAVRYLGKDGKVRIPKGVTCLSKELFRNASELRSVQIPSSVAQIPANPFAFCPKLENVQIRDDHRHFQMTGKVLFSQDGRTLVAFLDRKAESYEIPARVQEVAELAFGNCENLRSLTIPKGVRKIGLGAFWNCPDLLIYAPKDSEGLKCAKKRGIPHRAILEEPEDSGIRAVLGRWLRSNEDEQGR